MAQNFLINSPGQVTTGTDAGELFLFQSASVSASTVVGKAGNDTLQFLEGPSSADKVSISTEGGADLIQISAVIFNEDSTLKGGAGGDTVTFSAGGFEGAITLGDGSDLVQVNAAAELKNVSFGAGADRMTAAVALSAEKASFLMGSGADTVSFDVDGILSQAVIKGGGGADLLIVSATDGANSALSIAGGAGGDTIGFALADDDLFINGGDGNDKFTQSAGELNTASTLLGGAGADNISIIDVSGDQVLLGGGAGADTIDFNGAISGTISVVGGGGNDSITIQHVAAGINAGTVFGGAGADSITFSGVGLTKTGLATQIGISNFSDSTLSATDVVVFDQSGGSVSGQTTLDFVTDGIGTSLQSAANLQNNKVTIADEIVTNFTSTLSDLTARVAAIDALATTKGQVVAFMDNGADTGSAAYLFIQGGATDTLVEINELKSLSGISLVGVSNSAVSIEFKVNAL